MEGSYRNTVYTWLATAVIFVVGAMIAMAVFLRPDPAVVIPDKATAPPLVQVLPPQPSPTAQPAIQPATQPAAEQAKPVIAKKKVADKQPANDVEAAAAAKAAKNAERIKCLNAVVDYKIDSDIKAGEIRDWGSAIEAKTCRRFMTQATPGTLVGIRGYPGGPGVGLLLTDI